MKLLVVRFSSIGDIVLTTPVLRALKQQVENVEIHFIVKHKYADILVGNPYVDKIIGIQKSIDEVLDSLKSEKYDHIIDLHNNIRSTSLKKKLGVSSSTFTKLNWKKWLLVNFKNDKMPDLHVVDRYFDAVKSLNVISDNKEGDFIIDRTEEVNVLDEFGVVPREYICIAVGAQFLTKCMTPSLLNSIIENINVPAVLIGDQNDSEIAESVIANSTSKNVYNACGKYTLKQSASIVKQCSKILTNDTGMMHIAACLNVPIVSVWGNTVPAFGMYPYYPSNKEMYVIHEVDGLSCRPCSKIGYEKCPKGHFKCMVDQNYIEIAKSLLN